MDIQENNLITELEFNQIFVFGSNLNGNHSGGAALQAKKEFGAEEGVAEGLTGQCYAFPTLNKKMEKVKKRTFNASVQKLVETAIANPDKEFLLTKVGCGIAGFSERFVKERFYDAYPLPNNIILPQDWKPLIGFKATRPDLTCRGVKYEIGKRYRINGSIALCSHGFHFCKNGPDVYNYYDKSDRVFVIAVFGEVIDGDDKSVTNDFMILRELNSFEKTFNTSDSNTGYSNTGDSNTGDRNTGDSNTGDRNTGDSNTGDRNTGDRNTGDSNTGGWNETNRETGFFNTVQSKYINVFNKPCLRKTWEEAPKPNFLYFPVNEWVYSQNMTEIEKNEHPSWETVGGYLKVYDYKEAFRKSWERAADYDKKLVLKLPNFDNQIFLEISGINAEEELGGEEK